ncbi:MAG: hypothetical protein IJE48_06220 [Clostridia bacterium]|nr:hypothetical protein [Clostridia bacterium]
MKKTLSFLLVLATVFSLGTTALADSGKCSCNMTPVVYVPGFGEPIYKNPGTEEKVSVFPPEEDAITAAVPDIVKAVLFGLAIGNFDAFGTYAMKAADTILGAAACDNEGNPVENTGVEYEDPTVDTHKNTAFVSDDRDDNGYFMFIYDWRLDPIENARLLREYISKVKALTSHDEIVLSAHSQGNTVVMSYLYLYGNSGIEKLVLLSPAYQGLSLIGSLFAQEVSVIGKGDALAEYLNGVMGYENPTSRLIAAAIKEINKIGTVDGILHYLQRLLDDQLDRVFAECLTDIMGTLPGVWAFVPDEYYEAAKAKVFKGSDEYSVLIEKADYYHYNVQTETASILVNAKKSGTDIVICAGYNISSIPVTKAETAHSDFLIDTGYMSLGAVCAPFGKTLGEKYAQQKTACGHNHVSADGIADASTCLFPEYTWFFKNNGHASFGSGYCEFIEWAIRHKGQPTVHTNKKYPQFMEVSAEELVPVREPSAEKPESNCEIIISSLITLIKESVDK